MGKSGQNQLFRSRFPILGQTPRSGKAGLVGQINGGGFQVDSLLGVVMKLVLAKSDNITMLEQVLACQVRTIDDSAIGTTSIFNEEILVVIQIGIP